MKVSCPEDALNYIWHYGYEAKPADPENTPHVKKLYFAVGWSEITMIVLEYDWEEGIPIPFEQWDELDTIEHIYVYYWDAEEPDEEASKGCPQRAFRGA
jgi:hypothetical protein